MGISAGYALYDIYVHIMYPKEIESQPIIILHHLILIYGTMYYAVYPRWLAFGWLTEISTIFLNLAYLELHQKGRTKMFFYYAYLTISTFFVFRLCLLPYAVYEIYLAKIWTGVFIGSIIFGMNLFWFRKLIQSANK